MVHLIGPTPTPYFDGALPRSTEPAARCPYYADDHPPDHLRPKPYIKSVAGEPSMLAGHPLLPENLPLTGNFTYTTAAMHGTTLLNLSSF